jgi:hypothetical protein
MNIARRKSDGKIIEVDDEGNEIAKDGERVSVPMMLMDAAQRSVAADERSTTMDAKYWQDRQAYMERYPAFMHDADGNEVMPWCDYIGSDRHRKDLERCHAEVTAGEVLRDEERRRQPGPAAQVDQVVAAPAVAQPTADDIRRGRANVEAAYAEYNDRITNAWRGGR